MSLSNALNPFLAIFCFSSVMLNRGLRELSLTPD
jgi:hypothetical protein